MPAVNVGIIGDFNPENKTHTAISESLTDTGIACSYAWISSDQVAVRNLESFDGLWCAPGSPYRSLEGALRGIQFAREAGVPFLGTCAGFQHAVIEFARNVMGITAATSQEYDPDASDLFVSRLTCSLVGKEMVVRISPDSRACDAYRRDSAVEKYYCNFGLNSQYEPQLERAGMRVSGRDEDGQVRIVELPTHPFFVGTLFVPQTSSAPHSSHPLITAFMRAIIVRKEQADCRPGKDRVKST